MKTLIALLFFAYAFGLDARPIKSNAAPVEVRNTKPTIQPDGSVTRTKQQDAELKDWIVGLQAENQRNAKRADEASQSGAAVKAMLAEAATRADSLQLAINSLQEKCDSETDRANSAENTVKDQKITIAKRDKTIAYCLSAIGLLTLSLVATLYLLFRR